ncbi:hypothetical protein EQG49_07170 [Periweissella cryptocerci]|uniref:Uncharacterized protein n=1 Tax=Periweissella cryptocerci TaxID=2506420 RepID=A0A4V1AIP8_9LACO|nr:hypothetical protein [Periweissella cryptocerci]QBO36255.1 hypothetical protein EQG49_07170 [Periweissella cryptocerci]
MGKITYLELLAFFREKFQNKNIAKVIIVIVVSYFLTGYGASILFGKWINEHTDTLYQVVMIIGIIGGLTLTNKELIIFLQNIPEKYRLFPMSYKKIVFIKTIKYEIFTALIFCLLIIIVSFPILLTMHNTEVLLIDIGAVFLYLAINKITQLVNINFSGCEISGQL